MATRESLNKLNVSLLRKLAEEHCVNTKRKRKSELINEVLTNQVPVDNLTPVASNDSLHTAVQPFTQMKENLPPYNQVKYIPFSVFSTLVSFTTIYNFMVARKTESGGDISGFKGLDKALIHYDAGDIQELQMSKVDEAVPVVYVRASCLASMKKQKYDVYICFVEAVPIHAFCLCPIGLTQSCSYIGALLFTLANKKPDLDDTGSCTSNSCRWNVPSAASRSNQKPLPLSLLKLNKPKLQEGTAAVKSETERQSIKFDPRHSSDQIFNPNDALKHLQELKEVFPNTGMNHIWNIPDDVPDAIMEEEVVTLIDPLQTEMENMVFSPDNVPPLTIGEELVTYIEEHTRKQRHSQIWKDLHRRRITSSIFGDVLRAGSSPVSLIDKIMNGCSLDRYPCLPAAVQWGIDHEQAAKDQYQDLKSSLGPVNIVETGLTLCNTHSFLGASSDGRVFESDSGPGILEVKCPFSLNNNRITHMEIADIIAIGSNDFCLGSSNSGFTLKKTHKFYDQVQGEMAIMGLPWCDFVVWTAAKQNNICVDRVYFDSEHVQMMLPKLVRFYVNHVYPLLV